MIDGVTVAGVEVSRPDKVLLPADPPLTKLGLARYYDAVADVMLPHLHDRPVNMERLPDGLDGPSFYEKRRPGHFPDFVGDVEVHTADGAQHQVVVQDRRTLAYLAGQACVVPHTWLCRTDHLDAPDQLVVDLDPSVEGLAAVRRATRLVGEALRGLGLTTYLKTTGSRGYHVVVPLRPGPDFDAVRGFARDVAVRLAGQHPDLLTVEQRKADRGDRVYLDIGRNGYGQTIVPPYAVRARAGAPVSTPIEWRELSRVRPDQFTVASVRRRLARRACPWADLRRHAQTLPI